MEVPNEVLRKLLCENCENYLSRGPVLMLVDGRNRCGRCVKSEDTTSRNVAYEELAKLMTFPCRYKQNGCKEKVTFETNLEHEEACGYQKYICPILEAGKCNWSGIRDDLLKHCKESHSPSVLQNPVKLTHNITSSNLVNYLISAFSLMFLVQVKVCIATRKIYHAVRLFGNSNSAAKYRYDMIIENSGNEMKKSGNVLPQGCLVLQEETSIAVGINSVLEELGNFQNTTFNITVRAKDEKTKDNAEKITVMEKKTPTANVETSNGAIEKVKCMKCQCMREPVYREGLGWVCRICNMTKISCKYCCKFNEIDGKRQKHEMFFCTANKSCMICRDSNHSLIAHPTYYLNANVEYSLYTFSFSWACKLLRTRYIDTNCLCSYWLGDSDFVIYIFLDVPSNELHMFSCIVDISHPSTPSTFSQKLDVQYDRTWDWRLLIPRNQFSSYAEGNKFKMKILISKQQ